MIKFKVAPITFGQLAEFTHTARDKDLLECYHISQVSFKDSYVNDLGKIQCLTDDKGTVYAIGGLNGDLIWVLCTAAVEEHPIAFLKFCKDYKDTFLDGRNFLYNWVWLGNDLHVKWLHWMGAEFGEVREINGQPFQYFHFLKE